MAKDSSKLPQKGEIMREDITNQFDFVIGTLQICIGILQKMKGEEKV